MALAFVLMRVEEGTQEDVIAELRELPEVEMVEVVQNSEEAGFDLIIKAGASSLSELQRGILGKIRRVQKVVDTKTMIVIDR